MTYNEPTARLIIERFGLSAETLRVWKSRGSIPAKYFTDGGEVKTDLQDEPADKHQIAKMREIIRYGKLNLVAFTSITSVRFADIQRGKAALRKAEYQAFKEEVIQIHNKLRKCSEAKTYDNQLRAAIEVCKETRIHWYLCFTKGTIDTIKKGFNPEIDDLAQFQIDCVLLRQELNV